MKIPEHTTTLIDSFTLAKLCQRNISLLNTTGYKCVFNQHRKSEHVRKSEKEIHYL